MRRAWSRGGDAGVPRPCLCENELTQFADVNPDFRACNYIEFCRDLDVVKGVPAGDGVHQAYQPDGIVTRAEMAVYIQRALQLPL